MQTHSKLSFFLLSVWFWLELFLFTHVSLFKQGAETIVYLSLLSENENVAKGEFWYKMKSYDWSDIKLDLVDIFGAIYELENVNVR